VDGDDHSSDGLLEDVELEENAASALLKHSINFNPAIMIAFQLSYARI